MTALSETREHKQRLEKQLGQLLEVFEQSTGLTVHAISVGRVYCVEDARPRYLYLPTLEINIA